jgi:hypothetical protein
MKVKKKKTNYSIIILTFSKKEHHVPISYFPAIPIVPEFGSDRLLSPLRLREIKKSLDNGQGISEIESIAQECMDEIIELCSGKHSSYYQKQCFSKMFYRLYW